MSSTPVDANTSFFSQDLEAVLTTVEGTSMTPAQVRECITPLCQTSDFSASRVPPPRAVCALFVNLAARALEGRKISNDMLRTYTCRDVNAHFALMSGVAPKK